MGLYSDKSMTDLTDIEKIIEIHADRLGVDKMRAFNNAIVFADMVGTLENDGKLQGSNPKSTAKGLYQFLDESLETAKKRTGKYIQKEWSDNPNDMLWNEQTLLFLGDVLEKEGSDEIMRKVLQDGDMESMKEAYYKLHHTAPDRETTMRVESLYGDQHNNIR